jgi:hypothetical protein
VAVHATWVEAGVLGPGFDHAKDQGSAHQALRDRLRPGHRTEERKFSVLKVLDRFSKKRWFLR